MKYKTLLVIGIILGAVMLSACGNQQPNVVTETEEVTALVEERESEMETETETEESETEVEEPETEEPQQEPESEAEPEFEKYTRFTNTAANIRNLPTADGSEIIRTVPVNTEVTVIGVTGDWSQLESEDGTAQYIKSSLLGETKVEIASAPSTTAPTSTVEQQVAAAAPQQAASASEEWPAVGTEITPGVVWMGDPWVEGPDPEIEAYIAEHGPVRFD